MSQPAVEYRRPTDADIVGLATNLRQQDVAELEALGFTNLHHVVHWCVHESAWSWAASIDGNMACIFGVSPEGCLLYTSDAADEEDSVDLGGRRIIKKRAGVPAAQT